MQKHFVLFLSPGTIVPERTEQPIHAWDVLEAVKKAGEIVERYDARPFGFKFVTRGREPDDLDSKVIRQSNFYYLGGTVLTVAEIEAEGDPKNNTLLANMRANKIARVLRNDNSYRFTVALEREDVVLAVTLPALPDNGGAR
jgi:hypothetical protein